jgi:hypothetical protein
MEAAQHIEHTKRCPMCWEQILATAVKCKHCQSMLTEITPSLQPAPENGAASPPPASRAAPWRPFSRTLRRPAVAEVRTTDATN